MSRFSVLRGLVSIETATASTSATAAGPQLPIQTLPAATVNTTASTDMGTLLANPETKAVLETHVPQFVASEQIELARSMTLKQLQSLAGDVLTDRVTRQNRG